MRKSGCLFFILIDYKIRILNGYFILIMGQSSNFAYDFQKHEQEMTQVKLVLQNKLK